jgi:hypothetical protein
VGSKLFYDGLEMWIVSIYDGFVKLSCGLICDVYDDINNHYKLPVLSHFFFDKRFPCFT